MTDTSTSAMSTERRSVDPVLGAPLLEGFMLRVSGSRLRAVAYHGVPDRAAFRHHVEHLVERYRPVSGEQVADAVRAGRPLPRRSVWVTFDDGRPDVVTNALPELVAADVPATMFVCPGLLRPGARFWQTEVLAALARGGPYEFEGREFVDRSLVITLKARPDEVRRRVVDELRSRPGEPPAGEDTVSAEQVLDWVRSGREIGNHTWDHPCLDQCEPDEQRRQVVDAHDALTELLGEAPTLFAYPNGDWTPHTELVLGELGYRLAALFDHRLGARRPSPLRLSRLRLDSDAPPERMRAVLGGAHAAAFGARTRLQRGRPG